MRAIETASFADLDAATEFGPAPQLQWLMITDLVVDDSYQRPPTSQDSRRNIRQIGGHFQWRRFAPVIVSPIEGGRYAIIDGQHRTTGAALCGIARVPCMVVLATTKEQAEAFRAINGNVTQVSRAAIFKALLKAEDPEALHIQAVTQAAGVKILFSNRTASRMAAHETTALGAITRNVKAHGDAVVTLALQAIRAATPLRLNLLRADVIQAVAEVLANHDAWRRHPELLAIMANFRLASAIERAQAEAKRIQGVTTSLNLQAEIVAYLGKRLPEARTSMRAAQ